MLLDELRKNRDKILELAKESGLTDVRVFGSVARGEEREDSDIDILANRIEGLNMGLKTFTISARMEEMFGKRVDFVFEKGLNSLIRDCVLAEAKSI